MQKRLALVTMLLLVFALLVPVSAQEGAPEMTAALTLAPLGTYATGVFDEGAAEIVAYDAASQTVYVVNGDGDTIDLLNISDPANITLTSQLAIDAYGSPNSVAVYGEIVAVAADNDQDPGNVLFYSTAGGDPLAVVEVGALPDSIHFTSDGTKVLTPNEGEPNDDYSVDPEGSVSIIDISSGVEAASVTTVGFTDFNADGSRAAELPEGVRIYGPNATVAQDLEPEYIAISPDNSTAFVTLQEANALAIIDINAATVTSIIALGFKDHSLEGNGLDISNEDGAINIANWPVFGMYQPDGIAAYEANGALYLVTANEGDTRDYEGFSEEGEVSEITLDAAVFPNAAELQAEANMGKAEIVTSLGDTDGDGDFDALYLPGARSFTIWDAATGAIVFDSGDDFEQITAMTNPDDFNATNDENGSFDDRSDNKGPEPEGLTLGVIDGRTYAFIGLERIGGVMVYDITDPAAPTFVTYANNRDFAGDPAAGTAGDLGPEGLIFISAENSPTGAPLVVVANEISGSTTVYEISVG